MKAKHLSFTQINNYKECPQKFRFYDEDVQKQLPSEAMADGSEQHAKIAAAIRSKDDSAISEIFGPRLQTFFRINDLMNSEVEIKVEPMLITKTLLSFVDCIKVDEAAGIVTIVDWKRNNGFAYELQLKIYAAGFVLTHMDKINENVKFKCAFAYINQDYPEKYDYTLDQIIEVIKDLQNIERRILADNKFATTPGQQACKWCQYSHKCPAIKKFEVLDIVNTEMAITQAKTMFALDKFVSDAEKRLKEYMLKNDIMRLELGDGSAYQLTTSVSLKKSTKKGKKESEE